MRYYELTITQPGETTPQLFLSTKMKDGSPNPSALEIEFDIPVAAYDTPVGAQSITVYGIGLNQISQSKNFQGALLTLKGGMQQPGLPLANPTQAGILTVGFIFQVAPNWMGADMNITFQILPSPYNFDRPGNLVFDCKEGEDVGNSILNTLKIAFPDTPIKNTLPRPIITARALNAYYHTLDQFGSDMARLTSNLSSGLTAVSIVLQQGQFLIYEKPLTETPQGAIQADRSQVQLIFTDMAGQPTWIAPNTMQVTCVLRADIQIATFIKMPKDYQNLPGFVNTPVNSLPSSLKYDSAFKGTFVVSELRHTGKSRALDLKAWISTFNCVTYGQ